MTGDCRGATASVAVRESQGFRVEEPHGTPQITRLVYGQLLSKGEAVKVKVPGT